MPIPRLKDLRRAPRPSFSVPIVALILTAYVAFFGSINPEDSSHFVFSIGAGSGIDGWFDGPRQFGTYSKFGVPLYDSLQGVGARLPYKGNWQASVEWPLRLFATWQLYVLARVFLSTVVLLSITVATMRSWWSEVSQLRLVGFSTLCLAPSFTFLRWEEWSTEFSQFAAVSGLGMFLLRRELFHLPEEPRKGIFQSPLSYVQIGLCLSLLVTGHPGVFPIAGSLLVPLALSAIILSKSYRARAKETLRTDRTRLLVLATPLSLILATLLWELKVESESQPNWTVPRRLQAGDYLPNQAFTGVTRGLFPPMIENSLSVVFVNAFQPLSRLLLPLFPSLNFLKRSSDALPYGGFTGLLAVVVAASVFRHVSRTSPIRKLMLVIMTMQFVAVAMAVAAVNSWLPLEATPSGPYKVFLFVLPFNVLLTVALLAETSRNRLLPRVILYFNSLLVLLFILVNSGSLSENARLTIPERRAELVTAAESQQFASGSRSALLLLGEAQDDGEIAVDQMFGLSLSGVPLMQSAAQIRNSNNMVSHTPTAGGFRPLILSKVGDMDILEVLSFLQVEKVLIDSHRDVNTSVLSPGARDAVRAARAEGSKKIRVRDSELLVLKMPQNFSDVVVAERLSDARVCPLFERSCPIIREPNRVNASRNPKLSVCSDPCLWKYRTGRLDKSQLLVIPVTFDGAIRVEDQNGDVKKTESVAGFLGVSGFKGDTETQLTLTVDPDARMYSLVLTSYVSVLGFFALVALSFRGFGPSSHRAKSNRDRTW